MTELRGKKLIILGLARQGEALARFAAAAGAWVIVSDLRSADKLREIIQRLAGLGIAFVLGEHPLGLLDGADILAISGGVPADAPFVQAARERGVIITNDSQEFLQRSPAPVVGITGAAGKTTTTSLLGAMGTAAGRKTWVGGNIGRPLIADLAEITAEDLVVQELSSFQLEIWRTSPQIAAVTNITPNHLDRHKTMAAYSAAKAHILRYQTAADVAVLCADDAGAMALAPLVNGRFRTVSMETEVADGAFVRDGQIWLRDGNGETAVCPLSAIQLRGRHNIWNVLTAVTLADCVGIAPTEMAAGIRTFKGVLHRLEEVGNINGVAYINDSIATAPERAVAAIQAFDEPLILLAGGKDKDMAWETWAKQVHKQVKRVILFGELAPMLENLLNRSKNGTGHTLKMSRVETVAEAVRVAGETAVAGDIVLLSPGGTSFDAYDNFALRGDEFRAIVKGWQGDGVKG